METNGNYGRANDITFMDAVRTCFNKYADFSGRARRKEYWCFVAFNILVQAVLSFVGGMIFGSDSSMASSLTGIYSLAVLVPGLAVAWRRLHDVDKSGAFYFIGLIPVIGWIILLVQMCKDSQPGDNRFGPSPKYPTMNNYY